MCPPLIDVKKMKKNESRSFDFRNYGNIEIVRWNDNSAVTTGSNAYGVQPIGSAKRWIKGKEKQNIQKPTVIAAYNRGMGGADLLDRALSNLRSVIRRKKWYWPFFINAINISFVYSWRLFRIVSGETIPYRKISDGKLWVPWSDNQTHASSVLILVQQRLTKWLMKWDMMGWVIIPSAAQFGNALVVGKVAEIHVRSANEAYTPKYVSRFSMKIDNTTTLFSQLVLYCL